MAEGRSNSAIAGDLVVSGGAVKKRVASIFAKLGLPSQAATSGMLASSSAADLGSPA